MKIKRLTTVLIALCLSICLLAFTASAAEVAGGTCENGLTWVLTEDGTLTVSGNVPVPGYELPADRPWADYTDSVLKIVIEDGVTAIGGEAFSYCYYATEVSIPDSVTAIRYGAFMHCDSLGHVTIPEGVRRIEECAFSYSGIKTIDLPDSLIQIGANAFSFSKLTAVEIPTGVTEISDQLFWECYYLSSVTLPDGLTSIGYEAFEDCSELKEIDIPDSVTEIGESAFLGCSSLTSFRFPDGIGWIAERVLQECTSLTEIVIPDGAEVISKNAFFMCTSLTSITIPDSVDAIEDGVFSGCESLTEVVLPEHVSRIGINLLTGCASLKTFRFPCATAGVGWWAFSGCTNLETIYFTGNAPDFAEHTLGGGPFVDLTLTAYYPAGDSTWTEEAMASCGNDNITWVPYEIPDLGSNWGNLSWTLEDGILTLSGTGYLEQNFGSIPWETLSYRITEVVVEKGVTGLDAGLLQDLHEVTKVTLPEGLTYIGTSNFGGFVNLKEIKLPESLEYIGQSAFIGCDALTEVTIPANVTDLLGGAFSECDNLKKVVFRGDPPYYNFMSPPFEEVPAVGYYPADNEAWEGYDWFGGIRELYPYCELKAPEVTGSNVASTGKVKLTWNAVNGASSYKVYRATSKSGTYKLMKTVTDGTSYTNTSAVAGKTYYYYVVAVGADGTVSERSNVVMRTCDLPRPVVSISNVAKTGKIRLTWDAVDGAIGYKVYRATSKTGEYKLLKTTTGTSFTNTGAVAGKTYYYKVVAVAEKSAANSAYSSYKSRTCDLPRPDVSIALKNGKPRLTWDKVDGAVSYKIYRATSKNGTYKLIKTTTSTGFTNTGAKSGTTYYYKVVAVHSKSAANSAYSLIDSIKSK